MSQAKPLLVTGFTPGLYQCMHQLTGPIWQDWADSHGYNFATCSWRKGNRVPVLKFKLPLIVHWLERGRSVLWADVDGLPVIDSPDPAADMPADVHLAALVLPDNHPKSGHVFTGLFFATPGALPVLRQAVRLQGNCQSFYVDQRAVAAALAGLDRIPKIEERPAKDIPVKCLDRGWCRAINSKLKPKDRAWLWHASTRPAIRLATIRQWIRERRHLHPAGETLPLVWRRPMVLTET